MATSGTYTFDFLIRDVIEEAYELAGWEGRSEQDAKTARRSLNLIFSDWANWGVNLWTLELITTDCVASAATVTLTARTIDVLEAVLRTTSTTPDIDQPMQRISLQEYHNLPDKTISGTPNLFALDRQQDTPVVYLYPVPDDSTLDFVAWQVRYMQDVDDSQDNPDVPRRFLPALVWRLAYELSLKKKVNTTVPEMAKEDGARRKEIYQISQALFERAREEDSDAADLFIRPAVRRGR